jgi:hypothetical protein
LLTGCAQAPEVAAADQAREDFGCEQVFIRDVYGEPSYSACPPMIVTVQACTANATYRCRPGARDCDYSCRLMN